MNYRAARECGGGNLTGELQRKVKERGMHEIRFRRRVEFVDTDMSGIMHFSRYLVFMENAEHAFLAALGTRVQWREGEREMTFPRVAVSCEYLSATRFGDELEVHLK